MSVKDKDVLEYIVSFMPDAEDFMFDKLRGMLDSMSEDAYNAGWESGYEAGYDEGVDSMDPEYTSGE